MKRIFSVLLLGLAIFTFAFSRPALAEGNAVNGDPVKGAKVFRANCAQCHSGGKNSVNPQKTLKIDDLKKFHKDTADAIIKQVTNGQGAMPRFGGRLKGSKIPDVAAYVLEQANKGWKK